MPVEAKNSVVDVPGPIIAAFTKYLEQSSRIGDVTQLEVEALSSLKIVTHLLTPLSKRRDELKKHLANYEKMVEMAEQEEKSGFTAIYSNAIVALWSRLESLSREFAGVWLKNHPDLIKAEPFSRFRIRVGDFLLLNEEDRFHHLVTVLEQEVAAGIRNGVDRFESILQPLGLAGAIPQKLRRDMFEFGQIRNVVVHCSGIADRRFIEACPWLGLSINQEVRVSEAMFKRYLLCSTVYVTLVIFRVVSNYDKEGLEIDESREVIKKAMGNYFEVGII